MTCWDCGTEQPEGALFCNECGAYLLDKSGKPVRAPADQLPFTDEGAAPPQPHLAGQSWEAVQKPTHLTFIIPITGRRVQIPLEDDITVGRGPVILDLDADLGAQEGVSRYHALIRFTDEGLILIDQNSTNGTFLNNYRLPPEIPYMLNSGDELRFGDLLVHLFF
ncbi:MAG TPA: FHA domain-containing protein [Anaerolineae bacterium]|nr:FHA domain-containing protein [Anaerolineae bacterium]